MKKKSEYEISTSMNDGILEIIITGTLTGHNISKLEKEVDSLRATICDKLLVDVHSINEGLRYARCSLSHQKSNKREKQDGYNRSSRK